MNSTSLEDSFSIASNDLHERNARKHVVRATDPECDPNDEDGDDSVEDYEVIDSESDKEEATADERRRPKTGDDGRSGLKSSKRSCANDNTGDSRATKLFNKIIDTFLPTVDDNNALDERTTQTIRQTLEDEMIKRKNQAIAFEKHFRRDHFVYRRSSADDRHVRVNAARSCSMRYAKQLFEVASEENDGQSPPDEQFVFYDECAALRQTSASGEKCNDDDVAELNYDERVMVVLRYHRPRNDCPAPQPRPPLKREASQKVGQRESEHRGADVQGKRKRTAKDKNARDDDKTVPMSANEAMRKYYQVTGEPSSEETQDTYESCCWRGAEETSRESMNAILGHSMQYIVNMCKRVAFVNVAKQKIHAEIDKKIASCCNKRDENGAICAFCENMAEDQDSEDSSEFLSGIEINNSFRDALRKCWQRWHEYTQSPDAPQEFIHDKRELRTLFGSTLVDGLDESELHIILDSINCQMADVKRRIDVDISEQLTRPTLDNDQRMPPTKHWEVRTDERRSQGTDSDANDDDDDEINYDDEVSLSRLYSQHITSSALMKPRDILSLYYCTKSFEKIRGSAKSRVLSNSHVLLGTRVQRYNSTFDHVTGDVDACPCMRLPFDEIVDEKSGEPEVHDEDQKAFFNDSCIHRRLIDATMIDEKTVEAIAHAATCHYCAIMPPCLRGSPIQRTECAREQDGGKCTSTFSYVVDRNTVASVVDEDGDDDDSVHESHYDCDSTTLPLEAASDVDLTVLPCSRMERPLTKPTSVSDMRSEVSPSDWRRFDSKKCSNIPPRRQNDWLSQREKDRSLYVTSEMQRVLRCSLPVHSDKCCSVPLYVHRDCSIEFIMRQAQHLYREMHPDQSDDDSPLPLFSVHAWIQSKNFPSSLRRVSLMECEWVQSFEDIFSFGASSSFTWPTAQAFLARECSAHRSPLLPHELLSLYVKDAIIIDIELLPRAQRPPPQPPSQGAREKQQWLDRFIDSLTIDFRPWLDKSQCPFFTKKAFDRVFVDFDENGVEKSPPIPVLKVDASLLGQVHKWNKPILSSWKAKALDQDSSSKTRAKRSGKKSRRSVYSAQNLVWTMEMLNCDSEWKNLFDKCHSIDEQPHAKRDQARQSQCQRVEESDLLPVVQVHLKIFPFPAMIRRHFWINALMSSDECDRTLPKVTALWLFCENAAHTLTPYISLALDCGHSVESALQRVFFRLWQKTQYVGADRRIQCHQAVSMLGYQVCMWFRAFATHKAYRQLVDFESLDDTIVAKAVADERRRREHEAKALAERRRAEAQAERRRAEEHRRRRAEEKERQRKLTEEAEKQAKERARHLKARNDEQERQRRLEKEARQREKELARERNEAKRRAEIELERQKTLSEQPKTTTMPSSVDYRTRRVACGNSNRTSATIAPPVSARVFSRVADTKRHEVTSAAPTREPVRPPPGFESVAPAKFISPLGESLWSSSPPASPVPRFVDDSIWSAASCESTSTIGGATHMTALFPPPLSSSSSSSSSSFVTFTHTLPDNDNNALRRTIPPLVDVSRRTTGVPSHATTSMRIPPLSSRITPETIHRHK